MINYCYRRESFVSLGCIRSDKIQGSDRANDITADHPQTTPASCWETDKQMMPWEFFLGN